jgi:hypothetical protein
LDYKLLQSVLVRYNACLTSFTAALVRFSVVSLVVNTLIVVHEILLHEWWVNGILLQVVMGA